jgi:hypothetical protein
MWSFFLPNSHGGHMLSGLLCEICEDSKIFGFQNRPGKAFRGDRIGTPVFITAQDFRVERRTSR